MRGKRQVLWRFTLVSRRVSVDWLPRALLLASLVGGCGSDQGGISGDAATVAERDASDEAELGSASQESTTGSSDNAQTASVDAGSASADAATASNAGDAAAPADADASITKLDCSADAGTGQVMTLVAFNCTSVTVRACAVVDEVKLELADGSTQTAPGKHSQTGQFAGKGRNAGKTITAVTVVTGADKMKRDGAQRRFESTLEVDACAARDAGSEDAATASAADGGVPDAAAPGQSKGMGKQKGKGKNQPDASW